jgi:DICT domain-containing protein
VVHTAADQLDHMVYGTATSMPGQGDIDCVKALLMDITGFNPAHDPYLSEQEQEQSSAHSPSVPADTITYNHKYKWTVIPKLRSCRLSKKGTLKV